MFAKAARFVELYVRDSLLVKGLKGAATQLKAFGAGMSSMGALAMAAGAAITAPLALAAKQASDSGSALWDMAQRTGMSVENLSALKYAAEQSGTSLESVETAARKAQKAIFSAAQGSKEAQEALARLGLSVEDLVKLSPDQQFEAIAEKLAAIADPTQRAAMAMQVFGKQGTQLLPMIGDLKQLRAEAEQLGLIKTTEAAKAADEFGDALHALELVAKSLWNAIGSAVMPVMREWIDVQTGVARAVRNLITDNKEMVATVFRVASGITAGGIAFYAIGKAIGLAGSAISVFRSGIMAAASGVSRVLSVVSYLGSAFTSLVGILLSPVRMALGALGTVFGIAGQAVSTFSSVAFSSVRFAATALPSLLSGIASAVTSMVTGVVSAVAALPGLLMSALTAGLSIVATLLVVAVPAMMAAAIGYAVVRTAAVIVQGLGQAIRQAIGTLSGSFAAAGDLLGRAASGTMGAFARLPQLIEPAKKAFWDLAETSQSAWQGVQDALAAGDMGLAGRVAVAGLMVAFEQLKQAIMPLWIEIKDGFLTAFIEVKAWFLTFVENLKTAFTNLFNTVKSYASAIPGLFETFAELGKLKIQRALREAGGLSTESHDKAITASEALARQQLELAKRQGEEGQAGASDTSAIEAEKKKELAEQAAAAAAERAALGGSEADKALEAAKKDLAAATKAAAEARKKNKLPELGGAKPGEGIEAAAAKLSASGTFSSRALGMMSPEGGAQQKVAEKLSAIDKTNIALKAMIDQQHKEMLQLVKDSMPKLAVTFGQP